MAYLGQAFAAPNLRKAFLKLKAQQVGMPPKSLPSALPVAVNVFRPRPVLVPLPIPSTTPSPSMSVATVTPSQTPVMVSGPSAVTSGGELLTTEDGEVTPARQIFGASPLPLLIIGLGALFLLNRKGR